MSERTGSPSLEELLNNLELTFALAYHTWRLVVDTLCAPLYEAAQIVKACWLWATSLQQRLFDVLGGA